MDKSYWSREFPDIVACQECWKNPEKISDAVIRRKIAISLWALRSELDGRRKARMLHNSLKGMGIPTRRCYVDRG